MLSISRELNKELKKLAYILIKQVLSFKLSMMHNKQFMLKLTMP